VLASMVAAIYYARQGRWWLAGVLAGAACFTKQPSIYILIPLAYLFWQTFRANRATWTLRQKLQGAWLLLAPSSVLLYTLYRYFYLSAPISDAADLGGDQRLTLPGLPLIQAILKINPGSPLIVYNLMDIAFALLTIALVIGVA